MAHHQLVKGLVKGLRYVRSNPGIKSNLKTLEKCNENKNCLLLRRFFGLKDTGGYYFTLLSTEEEEGRLFSPKYHLYTPFPNKFPKPVVVIGSANGLLCFGDRNLSGRVVLWNPSTQNFKFLPPSSAPPPPPGRRISVLFSCSGFGFDQVSNDYKVVRVIENMDHEDEFSSPDNLVRYVEVYSLKSDSWKLIQYPKIDPLSAYSVCVGGLHYWIGVIDNEGSSCVLSFDFSTEKFESLPLPDPSKMESYYYSYRFFDFDGSLCIVVYPLYEIGKSFNIWVLNDDKSWSKIHDLRIDCADVPLGFWKKNVMFFESTRHELLMIDLATREMKNLGIHESPLTMTVIPHVASTSNPLF